MPGCSARRPDLWGTVVNLTTVEGGREVTREIQVYDTIGGGVVT